MKRLALIALGVLLACRLAQAQQPDEARAKKIVGGSCFLCHGMEGEPASEVFPRLAGQNAGYIAKQLENFKSGQRKSSAMAPLVEALTPEGMSALGRYYASRPAHKEPARDAQLAAVGQYIHQQGNRFSGVAACATCHGPTGAGTHTLPRLAGQRAAYIAGQLRQFHQRERTNDNAAMHAIADQMTPLEMAAVAAYLSGQRVRF